MDAAQPLVYQGQFGEFTITDRDRLEVKIYRLGLGVAAFCVALATGLVLWKGEAAALAVTGLYGGFCAALAVSLWTIHIYLKPLHQLLQAFLLVGIAFSVGIAATSAEPLALILYRHPTTLWGVGFTFAALVGIFFKEAFCFDRFETKLLTPLVPALILGHMAGLWPMTVERYLLGAIAVLVGVFAVRKAIQPIPPDIGDKSVFEHLARSGGQ
ncbi:MAG: DUF2301 domain-containing membrane protein [Cyanobacteria bacterium P01_A01_bin.135]